MTAISHGQTWLCTTCKKAVTTDQPLTHCEDCGGHFRPATDDDLACDRCRADDANRLLDRTGEYDRLCRICIHEVLLA